MSKTEEITTSEQNYRQESPKLHAWIASIVVIALIVITQFLPRGSDLHLRGAGVGILATAGIFIFAPFHLLAKHGKAGDDTTYMEAKLVVDRGLYSITRHPQYLGYMLLACGFALLSQHWVAILLATAGVAFFYLQAIEEERYCLTQLGKPYEQYCRRVPRFNVILGLLRLLRGGKE